MENMNKASFLKRFLAFMVDIILISLVATIISTPFMDNDSIIKLDNEMNTLVENFTQNEISAEKYVAEASSITYQLAKYQGLNLLVTLFLDVAYFVLFQFYAKGQTLGKKLLKIKIVSENGNLTINDLIIRSLLINSILVGFLQLLMISFVKNAESYILLEFLVECIQIVLIGGSGLMVMYSKNKKGIHDYIAHTDVITV